MRLTHRLTALLGGRRAAAPPLAGTQPPVEPVTAQRASPIPAPASPHVDGAERGLGATLAGGPGAAERGLGAALAGGPGAAERGLGAALAGGPGAAAGEPADPCAPARAAVDDACALADRMSALALAAQERHREARRAYDEHAGRRERAALAGDPRAVRAAKEEAQAAFRRARLAAVDRAALEAAAGEWLREIDRINARTRDARRILEREDAMEHSLSQAVERVGIEADGARIAAESAAESCRNARIALANCEEAERLGAAGQAASRALAPASVVARATFSPAVPRPRPDLDRVAAGDVSGDDAGQAPAPAPPGIEPAVLPLVAGDRAVLHQLAVALASGDGSAESHWQAQLAALVEAVRERAIDGAALAFPEDHPFWGPHTQVQCREIAAALAALGYRYDGFGGFADGRIPGQRELSLAIGYAGLDPMRVRVWPTEAELPRLMEEVQVDAGRFLAEAAGDLTLGEMIDLLGRRAEALSDLWNTWGRVRPLLLAPAGTPA